MLRAELHTHAHHPVVLSHIISQLRPGADLSRVVLPTFILEPRSMLERITKCVRPSCAACSFPKMVLNQVYAQSC
jgi:hypothetical protein